MGRPRVPLLSRERIRDAALSIIDRDGLSGLSMRKLAGDLGVQAASLYKHYPTKDDVLDDIARGVIGRVDTSAFEQGADWQMALASWARSYRDALAAHPNLVPYLAEGPGQREESMHVANAVHGGLVARRLAAPGGDADRCGHPTPGPGFHGRARSRGDSSMTYRSTATATRTWNRRICCASKADEIDTASFELALSAFIDGLQARFDAIDGRRVRRRAATQIRGEH